MSAWPRLRSLAARTDSRIGRKLDETLSADFGGIVLAPPLSDESVPAAGARSLVNRCVSLPCFRLVRVWDRFNPNANQALAWLEEDPVDATPDTIATDTETALDGLPFVELVSSGRIEFGRDVMMLAETAARLPHSGDPDIYLIIPRRIILHPWQRTVEIARAQRVDALPQPQEPE